MTKEEIEELIGLAAGMGLYDDKNPGKRAVILGKAIKELQQEPCKNAISRQEMLKYFEGWKNKIKYYHPYAKNFDIPYEEAIQWVKDMPPVNPQEPKTGWISVSDMLPDDLEPVNITWVNHNPESYYADIKDKPFTATGHYCNGRWWWYSVTCQDYLNEYGRCDVDAMDDDIEVIAWMPLPQPYKAEGSKG